MQPECQRSGTARTVVSRSIVGYRSDANSGRAATVTTAPTTARQPATALPSLSDASSQRANGLLGLPVLHRTHARLHASTAIAACAFRSLCIRRIANRSRLLRELRTGWRCITTARAVSQRLFLHVKFPLHRNASLHETSVLIKADPVPVAGLFEFHDCNGAYA